MWAHLPKQHGGEEERKDSTEAVTTLVPFKSIHKPYCIQVATRLPLLQKQHHGGGAHAPRLVQGRVGPPVLDIDVGAALMDQQAHLLQAEDGAKGVWGFEMSTNVGCGGVGWGYPGGGTFPEKRSVILPK